MRPALDSLDQALQREPRRELTLHTAGLAALELNETERSLAYWRRLLDLHPQIWQSQAYYGQALANAGQVDAAIDACRAALRLNPFEPRTRMLLINCLLHQGQKQRARDEFETLLARALRAAGSTAALVRRADERRPMRVHLESPSPPVLRGRGE